MVFVEYVSCPAQNLKPQGARQNMPDILRYTHRPEVLPEKTLDAEQEVTWPSGDPTHDVDHTRLQSHMKKLEEKLM